MLYHINDNEKILLAGNDIAVINNGSNVTIKSSNVQNTTVDPYYSTVSINNGNTVDLTNNELNNVLYGGSQLYNLHFDPENTEHQTFVDYNFPAAKYKVNGWRNVYSILVNDGISASWVPMNKGLLVGDNFVDDINYIPTRLNGFTTLYTVPDSMVENITLTGNYNGIIFVDQLKNKLTADSVYSLIMFPSPTISTLYRPTYSFSNIHNLQLYIGDYFNRQPATIKVHNVDFFNALINSETNIQISNSNLQYSYLENNISNNSYNATFSLEVSSIPYKKYLLSGKTLFPNFNGKNIFTQTQKFQKQLGHSINTTEGYNSNTPIGSVAWYPEIWSSYSPQDDKSLFDNRPANMPLIVVTSQGVPYSEDWKLCDGRAVGNCLYKTFYGREKTPNYKVNENYENSYKGWHYLDEACSMHILPNFVTLTPVTFTSKPDGWNSSHHDRRTKKFESYMSFDYYSDTNRYAGYKVWLFSNFRFYNYYTFRLDFNFANVKNLPLDDLIENLDFRLDTYGPSGDVYWNLWNGGWIGSLAKAGCCPTAMVNNQLYLDGFPITTPGLTGMWTTGQNNCPKYATWQNTINVPSLAIKFDNNDALIPELIYGQNRAMSCIQSVSWKNAVIENFTGKHPENDATFRNVDKYRQVKTFRWKLNPANINSSTTKITTNIHFRCGIPAKYGATPNMSHDKHWGSPWDHKYHVLNWPDGGWGFTVADYDDAYHNYCQCTQLLFWNPRIYYRGIEIPVSIPGINYSKTATYNSVARRNNNSNGNNNISINPKSMYYNSLGLWRRLNPYIKINNSGQAASSPVPSYRPTLVQTKTVIQVRKATITDYNDYNFDAIRDNYLSNCYIPPLNTTFKNNVVNFEAQVEEYKLTNGQNINILCGNVQIATGTLYNNDSNFYYIDLESDQREALETALKTNYSYVNDENQTVNNSQFYDKTYSLKKYNTILNHTPLNTSFYYTFWFLTQTENEANWNIQYDLNLVKFAANQDMFDSILNMLNDLRDTASGTNGTTTSYFNSISSCVPVFIDDYVGDDEGTGNDAVLVNAYYFLGSTEGVPSARSNISKYGYNMTYYENYNTSFGKYYDKSYTYCEYTTEVTIDQLSPGQLIEFPYVSSNVFQGIDNPLMPRLLSDPLIHYYSMIPLIDPDNRTEITQEILDTNDAYGYLNNNSIITAEVIIISSMIFDGSMETIPDGSSATIDTRLDFSTDRYSSGYTVQLIDRNSYTVYVDLGDSYITPATWNDDVYRCLSSYVTYLSSQINTITTPEQLHNLENFEQNYSDTRRQLSGTALAHDDRILDRI